MTFASELQAIYYYASPVQRDSTFLKKIAQNAGRINTVAEEFLTQNIRRAEPTAAAVCAIFSIIFGRNDGVIKTSSDTNWSQNCSLSGQCSIKPCTTMEVAVALKIITLLDCKFSVWSSGHNLSSQFFGVGSEATVSIGTGSTWNKVYHELENYGLTVVGERGAGVGVGDLMLGGGISHFTNAWRLVAINVKSFEVVLANSQVVTASARTNQDLFKALKGGGANFGIVTRCELFAKPKYKQWHTVKSYSVNDVKAVMEAAAQVERNMITDEKAGFSLTATSNALIATMYYQDWSSATPAAFSPFENVKPLAKIIPETNGAEESSVIAETQGSIAKCAVCTVTVKTDAAFYAKTLGFIQEVSRIQPEIQLTQSFQPISPLMIAKSNALSSDLLNLQAVSQAFVIVSTRWTDPGYDKIGLEMAVTVVNKITKAARADGKLLENNFMNDSNLNRSPLGNYEDQRVGLMKEASAKYDPEGIFQRLQNNVFLISKMEQAEVL
ncbi:FAD-binding domain-containing protein [Periconia macrospinosa]|uniref:FAD-binding domain-containing protein n=1 Tax=Periconia macrospinosa TaxID=97972 RepID=A0A2V1DAP8_9PLEO|nr:FAD-binding domain-containing protein [Periconia macrospinosa]